MQNFPLSFKQKLLLGITLAILVVFGIGGGISNWLLQDYLRQQARQQMDVTSQAIQTMVESLVIGSIKNYLKGIAESNLAYIQQLYEQFLRGEIDGTEAKRLAESYMLRQQIGSTGYLTAVDTSGGAIRLAVHPHFKGRDISMYPFAQQMARQKRGYMEFEWQNPGDSAPRRKAQWMGFFEPWQWIVSAAPFRDEYPELVDLEVIESELTKVVMPGQGYAFILDLNGYLLSHPTWKGLNILAAVDVNSGKPFVREMIDTIKQKRVSGQREKMAGEISYTIKDPFGSQRYTRMMSYRYVPETEWIVGVVTDLDNLVAPLRVIRNTQLLIMFISILAALLVILWITRPMTHSIAALRRAVEGIEKGRLDTPIPVSGSDEIGQLAISFSQMAHRLSRYTIELEQRVAERTAELEKVNQQLTTRSNTDGLTGIANRRRFDEFLLRECKRQRRKGQSLALIMLDVDFFKLYNDYYGHQAGDNCLKWVASQLSANIRRGGDLVARYGGEEFAVILNDTQLADAQAIAEKIRKAIEESGIPHQKSPFGVLTVSLGIAVMEVEGDKNSDDLVREADQLLYRAKQQGRNCVGVA
jgi:diguanylate cyclase (GGDEF)-like protein